MGRREMPDNDVEQLRLAVGGEPDDDLDMLIWRAGDLRRRTEDAHAKLDTLGVSRTDSACGEYSVLGRLMKLLDGSTEAVRDD